MSVHFPAQAFADAKPVVLRRNRVPRTFDLHPGIYWSLFGLFTAFLVVMAVAFASRDLSVTFAICFAYLGMYFAVPAMWARIQPREEGPRQSWAEFMIEGIETGSGRLEAKGALAQIFTVPVLLLGWALAVALIKAFV